MSERRQTALQQDGWKWFVYTSDQMAFFRQRWAFGALVLSMHVLGLQAACGLPEYRFSDEAAAGSGSLPSQPTCKSDADCAEYSATRVCNAAAGLCVECSSSVSGKDTGCGAGSFCAPGNRCSIGCAADSDCLDGLTCDVALHRCVGCDGNADCALGTICAQSVCVPSCQSDASCPAGFSCCDGECRNPGSDALHCGGCASACSDSQQCVNGACAMASCRPATANCDGKPGNGCEANLATDASNCGGCASRCAAGSFCSGGRCTSLACPNGRANCDNDAANECETELGSPESCGLCARRCNDAHGEARCDRAVCSVTCDQGFANCDQNADNGCESDLRSDDEHCGECGLRCENENGSSRCGDSVCEPSCATGFQDCDGRPENGCEADILESEDNCGGCRIECDLQHALEVCDTGVCEIVECEAGFEDCDGDASNGCEADLSSVATCGSCDNECTRNGGTPSCVAGRCAIACAPGRADCSHGLDDGCEARTSLSTSHCGACGRVCDVPATGSAACNSGVCGSSSCVLPMANCETGPGANCETNVENDAEHCGGCGNECYYPHGIGSCSAGKCALTSCEQNFGDCDDSRTNGCETRLDTTSNCSRCGDRCTNAHGQTRCTDQACSPTCAVGFGDCDGNTSNGCETPLDTLDNCGACGADCKRANATTTCSGGSCTITACAAGWDDCDYEPQAETGCETNVRTSQDCGGCNVVCDLPNANESCRTGSCEFVSCLPGFDDCSDAPGCETALGTARDCSACGDVCQTQNVHVTRNVCTSSNGRSSCSPTCTPGWQSCDNVPSNGCETDLTSPSNCGECGIVCDLPHVAQHACNASVCQVATCDPGYAQCDTNQTNGCERPVDADVNNCGSCNNVCSSNHGTATCSAGACSISCSPGFGNCDNALSNGCEHDTSNDPANCGACSNECQANTPFCVASTCVSSLPITVEQKAAGSAVNGADVTLNYDLKTAPGNYRLLVVGVAGRGNGSASRPAAVTFGDRALSLVKESTAGQVYAGIYTLSEAELPAAGRYPLRVEAASAQNTFGLSVDVLELRGVARTSNIDASGSTGSMSCAGAIVTPLAVTTARAYLYGIVAFDGSALPASLATSMQTVTQQTTSAGNPGLAAGYYGPVASVGTRNFSWADPTPCTWTQTAMAIRPATAP